MQQGILLIINYIQLHDHIKTAHVFNQNIHVNYILHF